MATISLTQQETLLSFELDESQIEMVRADVGGSYVERSDPHNTGYNGNPLFVTQTPAQIAAQSENLIPLTISKAGDQWTAVFLNGSVNHFGSVQSDTSYPSVQSRFEYFHNGNTMGIFLAQETPSAISALLQQTENGQNNPVKAIVDGVALGIYPVAAADLAIGYVSCIGTGPYNIVLPSATDLATQLNASAGSVFTFVVTNTSGGLLTITKDVSMTDGVNAVGSLANGDAAVITVAFVSATAATIGQTV